MHAKSTVITNDSRGRDDSPLPVKRKWREKGKRKRESVLSSKKKEKSGETKNATKMEAAASSKIG